MPAPGQTPERRYAQRPVPEGEGPASYPRADAPEEGGGAPAREGFEVPMPAASAPEAQNSSEHPADLVFIVRADGEIRFANRPHGGLSEDELVGTSLYEWIAPTHRDLLSQSLATLFATGETQTHDLAGLETSAGAAWYEWRLKPNRRDGAVVSATVVAHDISRHKRALHELDQKAAELEQLLRDRTADLTRAQADLSRQTKETDANDRRWQRFRSIVDEAGEAIFVTDPGTGCVVDANETACRWLRRSWEELVGTPAAELNLGFPILPPEEAELTFTETRDTRRPLVIGQCTHRRSDGSTFPVEVAVARHQMGGEDYVLAVVRDVKGRACTEDMLKESETQYRRLFEQSWQGVYLTARDGKVVDANDAALELFGYSREEFVGIDARRLIPSPDDIRAFQRGMGTDGEVKDLAVGFRTKAGERKPGRLSASRRLAPDGAIRGYQCLVTLDQPGAGQAPAAPRPATRPELVLLVDGDAAQLAQTTAVLEAAGIAVLTADRPEQAPELFRENQPQIKATVIAAEPGSDPARRAVESIRHLNAQTPVILLSAANPVRMAESFADLGIAAFLKQPAHPLALVQRVRDADRR